MTLRLGDKRNEDTHFANLQAWFCTICRNPVNVYLEIDICSRVSNSRVTRDGSGLRHHVCSSFVCMVAPIVKARLARIGYAPVRRLISIHLNPCSIQSGLTVLTPPHAIIFKQLCRIIRRMGFPSCSYHSILCITRKISLLIFNALRELSGNC